MSGGIDSSVAAILLLEQGYELVGVTFRTYDSIKESCLAKEKGCCSVESIMEAKRLAEKLGFEHHIVDYRQIFRDTVIENFKTEYMHGRTPNPCVLCNSHIKWGELLRAAEEFGCNKIATGHYARIADYQGRTCLQQAVDLGKDQTYFLWMLTEEQLQRTVFPLGGMLKSEVRQLAAGHGFVKLSQKKESQEICFIPDNDYRIFLVNENCKVSEGSFIDKDGNRLGSHSGYCNYTIGQRKGLGIALGEPKYVVALNAVENTVQLGSHDELYTNLVSAGNVRLRNPQWIVNDPHVEARIRYRSKAVSAQAELKNGNLLLHTDEPVWGVTPGQSLVLYKNGILIGGGIIN